MASLKEQGQVPPDCKLVVQCSAHNKRSINMADRLRTGGGLCPTRSLPLAFPVTAQVVDLASLDGGSAQAASAPAVELPGERKRVMLAGVKSQLYHPSLPTLRQMDIDTANSRLPDEHCRTTTLLTKGDFDQAHFTLFEEPEKRLACLDVTKTGQRLTERYREGKLAPLHQANWPKLTRAVEDYSRFISAGGKFKLPKVERKSRLGVWGVGSLGEWPGRRGWARGLAPEGCWVGGWSLLPGSGPVFSPQAQKARGGGNAFQERHGSLALVPIWDCPLGKNGPMKPGDVLTASSPQGQDFPPRVEPSTPNPVWPAGRGRNSTEPAATCPESLDGPWATRLLFPGQTAPLPLQRT
uniref:Uncharacterized protein n=1 Tax=Ornithorhynchus anatinus TaxID=9258 RepID=A0A6I8NYU8_ORNAN